MNRRTRKILLIIVAIALTLVLSSCIPGDGKSTPIKPSGFFSGIWHGWIAPVSLIMGLFKRGIRVYEQINTGWWYDFGFYIALVGGFGGIALSRRVRRDR
jgi:hypothetical protein